MKLLILDRVILIADLDYFATPVPDSCDTSAAEVAPAWHECDTSETRATHECDTSKKFWFW